ADTAYYVRVKASGTGAIDSQYTIIQTKTAAIPHLDSPTLAVKSAATTSLTISVGAVAGASRYILEYSASADFSSKKTKTLTKPGEVNLTSLKADTAYYVRVKASGSGAADSPYGGPMEARTLSAALSNAPSPNTLLANGLTGQSAEGALLSSDMIAAAAGAVLEDDPLFETLAASAQAWEPPVKSTYTGGYAAAEAYDTDELEICLDLLAGEAAFGMEAVL
ncbi:MAG: fibronectin type III domain-containing protein, partial [Thermoguttaceae bacterium]|nr:fibronectin type III domain-containing protein [Thermoguttaceae bacterium]